MTEEQPTFYLGITMAGAVSAGAYTAGVLDYLFRAVDDHNARAARGPTDEDPDPPRHRVVIKVMSGASAGGVCAGLTVAGLLGARDSNRGRLRTPKTVDYPALDDAGRPTTGTVGYVVDPLYDCWVDGLDLWVPSAADGLLAVTDVGPEAGGTVGSLFDSSHIDRVSDRVLGNIQWPGATSTDGRYSFVADDLELFLTTTDLRGVPYAISFAAGGAGTGQLSDVAYTMTQHSIARHFRVSGLGRTRWPSPWLEAWRDDGMPLRVPVDPQTIPFQRPGSPWHALRVSAIASGAFPAGLAARWIEATASELGVIDPRTDRAQGGAMPIELNWATQKPPRPYLGEGIFANALTPFVAVDGGVANNEPFELARFTIRRPARTGPGDLLPNEREAHIADRSVIMIDPFPEGPEYTLLDAESGDRLIGLVSSAMSLFPTLIGQARFKSSELVHANDPTISSRFMVSPRRSEIGPHLGAYGADAVAGGAFDGFGGFFDQSFRLHDFVLGQRNCQNFLREHFLLSVHNPVLGLPTPLQGAPTEDGMPAEARRRIVDPSDPGLAASIMLPQWPQTSKARLRQLGEKGRARFKLFGYRIIDSLDFSRVSRFWWRVAWWGAWATGIVQSQLFGSAKGVVLAAMVRRNQLDTTVDLSPLERRAVVKLVALGRPVTVAKLFRELRRGDASPLGSALTEGELREALSSLAKRQVVRRAFRWPWAEERFAHRL